MKVLFIVYTILSVIFQFDMSLIKEKLVFVNFVLQQNGKFLRRHGDPGEAIVSVAEKEKATFIVTGCRGMGLLRRTFMGSVSDYVMHHAHCPVLVCRK